MKAPSRVQELQDLTAKVSGLAYFSGAYLDGRSFRGGSFEDDGFIHIVSGRHRVVFYNGQEPPGEDGDGVLDEDDIPSFARQVERALNSPPDPVLPLLEAIRAGKIAVVLDVQSPAHMDARVAEELRRRGAKAYFPSTGEVRDF